MRMTNTNDGWLPESIFVIGQGPGGYHLIGAHSYWPTNKWFDRGSDAAGPDEHVISGFT
jgi:hypothetical protein